jgi:hypothetical protein
VISNDLQQVPHSPSIEKRSDYLLPTTPWLSSGVRLGTAEPNGSIKGVVHSLMSATEVSQASLRFTFRLHDAPAAPLKRGKPRGAAACICLDCSM